MFCVLGGTFMLQCLWSQLQCIREYFDSIAVASSSSDSLLHLHCETNPHIIACSRLNFTRTPELLPVVVGYKLDGPKPRTREQGNFNVFEVLRLKSMEKRNVRDIDGHTPGVYLYKNLILTMSRWKKVRYNVLISGSSIRRNY